MWWKTKKDKTIDELGLALIHTVEYVGMSVLPPIDGWSWYDALKKVSPKVAEVMHSDYGSTSIERNTKLLMYAPRVAPLGWEVNSRMQVQEVWDAFVKPSQDAGEPQSGEMRVLMAILRAMYSALPAGTEEP